MVEAARAAGRVLPRFLIRDAHHISLPDASASRRFRRIIVLLIEI
jgi:hypothetical protein